MVSRSICRVIALLLLVAAFPATRVPAIAQTTGGSIAGLAVNPTTNRICGVVAGFSRVKSRSATTIIERNSDEA